MIVFPIANAFSTILEPLELSFSNPPCVLYLQKVFAHQNIRAVSMGSNQTCQIVAHYPQHCYMVLACSVSHLVLSLYGILATFFFWLNTLWPTLYHFLPTIMIISLSQIEFLASLLNPFICPYGTVQQYPLISLEPAVLSLCLFPLITHSTLSIFSLVVTCRHKCFTFLKEVYKMPVASLAFATTSSFPFLFFISEFFESIVWCSCPPPWLQLCFTTIVISVYCDLFLAKVQIQFFIFLPLSATFVTISCAALEALFHLVSWPCPLLITSFLSTGFAEAVVHYSPLFVWLAERSCLRFPFPYPGLPSLWVTFGSPLALF